MCPELHTMEFNLSLEFPQGFCNFTSSIYYHWESHKQASSKDKTLLSALFSAVQGTAFFVCKVQTKIHTWKLRKQKSKVGTPD